MQYFQQIALTLQSYAHEYNYAVDPSYSAVLPLHVKGCYTQWTQGDQDEDGSPKDPRIFGCYVRQKCNYKQSVLM